MSEIKQMIFNFIHRLSPVGTLNFDSKWYLLLICWPITVSCGGEACQSSGYKLHSPKGTLPVAGLTWDTIPDLWLVSWANLSPLIGPYPRQPTWAPGSRDPDQSHNLVSGSQSEIYLRALNSFCSHSKFRTLLTLGHQCLPVCWLSSDLLLHF